MFKRTEHSTQSECMCATQYKMISTVDNEGKKIRRTKSKSNKHERKRKNERHGNNNNNNNNHDDDGSGFFSGFSHFYVLFSSSASCLSKDSPSLLFNHFVSDFGCFLKSNALFSNQFNAISAYTHTHSILWANRFTPTQRRRIKKIRKIIVITIRTLIILCPCGRCACVGRFVHTIQCHLNCEFGWPFFIWKKKKREEKICSRCIHVHGKTPKDILRNPIFYMVQIL